jgi:hypothetical protein
MKIKPGYYLCIKPFNPEPESPAGRKFAKDSILCLLDKEGTFLSFKEHHHYIITEEELAEHFQPLTEEAGIRLRSHETYQLQLGISRISQQATTTQHSLGVEQDRLIQDSETEVNFDGQLVAPVSSRMGDLKARMTSAKLEVASIASQLRTEQAKFAVLLNEQRRLAEGKLEELTALMDRMGEAILLINLYLGRNEEITPIRTGSPAESTDPICFRQRRLFMDEECAINPQEGGVDIHTIQDFDDWLCRDNNLQQILPESKGVVALQVRRESKHYSSDGMINFAMNEHNFTTYFLIRNGDNLWRICNDVSVGDNLFPASTEYDHFFKDSWSKKPLTPGSADYYRALEKADKARGLFMRSLLLLQGLIDRTQVFRPTDYTNRVSLSDPSTWGDSVKFIYDNERLLQDTRPNFNTWLRALNKQLQPGMRICGEFNSYATKQYTKVEERKTRPHASNPDTHILYPISQHKGEWSVLYSPQTYGDEPTPRARFTVYPSDTFIINFDGATLEDLQYYLHDRASRSSYLSMIPLLRACIRLKHEEAAAESPFMDLIYNKGAEQLPDLTRDTVAAICSWWKFKTKEHRPLLADNAKAYKMIMAELQLNAQRHQELSNLREQIDLSEDTLSQHLNTDNLLLFSHKKGREFVALRRASTFTHFIHEETYHLYQGKGLCLKSTKEWVMADTRHLRWRTLYEDTPWNKWPKHLYAQHFLTDIEAADAVQRIRQRWENIMLITWKGDTIFNVYFKDVYEKPSGLLMDGRVLGPKDEHKGLSWERRPEGDFRLCLPYRNSYPALKSSPGFSYENKSPEWLWEKSPHLVLWRDPDALAALIQEHIQYAEAYAVHRTLDNLNVSLSSQVVKYVEQQNRDTIFQEYTSEGGHPDFFEDHLKTCDELPAPHCQYIYPSFRAKIDESKGNLPDSFPLSFLLASHESDTLTITHPRKPKLTWDIPTQLQLTCL